MSDLSNIVKAYDVRGTVPDQLNVEVAHALGVSLASLGAWRGGPYARGPWEVAHVLGASLASLGAMGRYKGSKPKSRDRG